MGGQSSGNQTVRNVTEIDPVTQQWRSQLMGAGNALYNQGAAAYYPGATVVPFANQTQMGLDYLQGHAMQGAPNYDAANAAAQRGMSGWNPAMPYAMNAAAGGLGGNPANTQLSGYGQGVNPGLQSLWQQGAGEVTNAVNANFAKAGRFGPNAAHTGELTQQLGNLWSQIHVPAWEAERNRGLTAAQIMGGLYDSGANRTLAGAELAGSIYSQGNQDAARATALLPSLWQYGQQPGQAMLDIGGMYEGQAQNYLNADMDRYNYNGNANWENLQRYAGLLSGMPDFSGSTQTRNGPGTNRIMSGLGGAATGAGLAGALGMGGHWGLALGGLGALAGLFG